METLVNQEKNQKTVRVFTWILIIIASLSILSGLAGIIGSYFLNSAQEYFQTMPGKAAFTLNMTPIIIINSIKILISIFILLSAIFVLQYKETWRKQIIIGLMLAIAYLLVSPLVNYFDLLQFHYTGTGNISQQMQDMAKTASLIFSYGWSVIFSVFFIVAIVKYNNKDIKLLFK